MGNVETMLLGYAAWSSRDVDEMFRHLSDDVVMEPSGLFPGVDAEYRGRAEFLRFMETIVGPWEQFTIEPVRLIEVDEHTVVGLVRFRGLGRGGIELEREFGHLITFRDGLATHVRSYNSWDDVLAAAGVTE